PMPPFQPRHVIPEPAPIAPAGNDPSTASAMATATCVGAIVVSAGLLNHESSHSPTTGATTSSTTPGTSRIVASITPWKARPTLIVAVSTIGVSNVPHSPILKQPVNSPAAL